MIGSRGVSRQVLRYPVESVTLTTEGLTWCWHGQPQSLLFSDILRVTEGELSNHPDETAPSSPIFWIDACPQTCRSDLPWLPHRWRSYGRALRRFEFVCASLAEKQEWVQTLEVKLQKRDADCICVPNARLLVLINPKSGQGKARDLFDAIRPVLELRGVRLSVIELSPDVGSGDTAPRATGSGETREGAIAALDLYQVDGIVVVGGDGSVYQVFNGLMARPDWERVARLPLGIIPAGTSNGLCKTLLDQAGEPYDVMSAAWLIAKGTSCPLDILKVIQPKEPHGEQRRYGLLSLSWALISEIDLGTDRWRFLGPLRTDLYALWSIMRLPTYPGHLSLSTNSDVINSEAVNSDAMNSGLDAEFVALWAMNVPWAAHNMQAAPRAQPCDGWVDVLSIRRGITRWQLFQAFLAIETGGHVSCAALEYYKTRSFELIPAQGSGAIALDGEPIASAPTTVEVMPGFGRVMSRQS